MVDIYILVYLSVCVKLKRVESDIYPEIVKIQVWFSLSYLLAYYSSTTPSQYILNI